MDWFIVTGTHYRNQASDAAPHIQDRSGIYVNPCAIFQSIVLLGFLLYLIDQRGAIESLSLANIARIASVLTIASLVSAVRVNGNNLLAPSSVYLLMLSVFHMGLVSVVAFGTVPEDMEMVTDRWLLRPSTSDAVYVATLGVIACGIGIQIAHLNDRGRPTFQSPSSQSQTELELQRNFAFAGALLLSASVLAWFFFVGRIGGLDIFTSSYATYLQETAGAGAMFGFIWFGIGLGLSFLASTEVRTSPVAIAVLLFGVFSLVALPLGLRGEVLFPLVTAAAVWYRRHKAPRTFYIVAWVISLLFCISVLRELRQSGVASMDDVVAPSNVLSGLAELGSSLRPVAEVIGWNQRGDEFLHGSSYIAPFDRALCSILSPSQCISAGDDLRLMNVVVQQRIGPIGFSPVAEAYRNFGSAGVVILLFGIGLLVGWMDKWPATAFRGALLGAVLLELLINVRNAFTATPSHVIIGLGIVLLIVSFTHVFRTSEVERRKNPT